MTNFKKMYDEWYYLIEGAGGDLNEWKEGYQEFLNNEKIGKIKEWVVFTGKDLNNYFDSDIPEDIVYLAFPIDNLDASKLAMLKLRLGDRWFPDFVDNKFGGISLRGKYTVYRPKPAKKPVKTQKKCVKKSCKSQTKITKKSTKKMVGKIGYLQNRYRKML